MDTDGPATGTRSPSPATKKRKVVYMCEPCGTSYTEKRALARHRHTAQHRRNLGLPPSEKYSCTLCSKTFSREHDRVRHVNETHRGQKRAGRNKDAGDSDASPTVSSAGQTPPLQRGVTAQYEPFRSWFAESSGSEDEDDATSRFQGGNEQPSNVSTAADSAVDMAESGHDGYQSKPRSFASSDIHPEQHDPQPQPKENVEDELAAFRDLSLKPLP
ncbi:hypothetical protein KC343_g22342, partial [Hortaea werneckii]